MKIEEEMNYDEKRMEKVVYIIEEGKEERVIVENDINKKKRMIKFGGKGY
jgi:hypothetical protein